MTDLEIRSISTLNPPSRTRVAIRINDDTLRLAVTALLQGSEYSIAHDDDGQVRLVSDDSVTASPRTILFVDESPGATRTVVDTFVAGKLGSVISRRHPQDLLPALNSLDAGLATASSRVLATAADAPSLGARQVKILSLVIAGRSNGEIARQIVLSEATIKREISALLRTFEATSRVELAMKSAAVGFAQ